MAAGLRYFPADDRHRVPWVHAAMGPDVLPRRERDYGAVWGDPLGRRKSADLDTGRAVHRQPDPATLLFTALPVAVHYCGRRRAAHLGAARAGQ